MEAVDANHPGGFKKTLYQIDQLKNQLQENEVQLTERDHQVNFKPSLIHFLHGVNQFLTKFEPKFKQFLTKFEPISIQFLTNFNKFLTNLNHFLTKFRVT